MSSSSLQRRFAGYTDRLGWYHCSDCNTDFFNNESDEKKVGQMTEKYAWEGKNLDEVSAKELWLFITNDGDLYRQQHVPILRNLTAKKARESYQSAQAAMLFGYLVETGAKKYAKEFGSNEREWNRIFPKKLRDAVAEELRDSFETEYDLGNYSEFVPMKYRAKSVKTAAPRRTSSRGSVPTSLGGMR